MLTQRKRNILNMIVGDYISSGAPIGSESIARRHGLAVSPATIRNDVAELEQEGYLTRPHTSAGTVPCDRGYRLYVETVMAVRNTSLPDSTKTMVRNQLSEVETNVDGWSDMAATILANLVGNMAIATFPRQRESRINHVEVVRVQDLLVLLIVVFQQTRLKRHLIRLKQPVESNDLVNSSNKVNKILKGLSLTEIQSKKMKLNPFERELVDATAGMLKEEDTDENRYHALDGLHNLLRQPEFGESEMVRSVVRSVEDGSLANAILDKAPEASVIRVVIGQENSEDLLWPLSIVVGRYGIPGRVTGTLGAIGPVRMEYTRTIAGVELMSDILSGMVEDFQVF